MCPANFSCFELGEHVLRGFSLTNHVFLWYLVNYSIPVCAFSFRYRWTCMWYGVYTVDSYLLSTLHIWETGQYTPTPTPGSYPLSPVVNSLPLSPARTLPIYVSSWSTLINALYHVLSIIDAFKYSLFFISRIMKVLEQQLPLLCSILVFLLLSVQQTTAQESKFIIANLTWLIRAFI